MIDESAKAASPAKSPISRRDFARASAIAASAACLPALVPPASSAAEDPALTSAGQAEVNATVAAIVRKYGNRLSDPQKLDVRRIVTDGQKSLESMRSFLLTNADQPANVLKLYPDAFATAPPPAPSAARHAAADKK